MMRHRAIVRARDRQVRNAVLGSASANAREEAALRMEIATDEDGDAPRDRRAAERSRERDRLRDARVTAELLHVVARDDAAEAVPDDVHARLLRKLRDEVAEIERDVRHGRAGQVGEARDARSLIALELLSQRTEHARAREETMDENDDVAHVVRLLRNALPDVARHEHHFAKGRERFSWNPHVPSRHLRPDKCTIRANGKMK